MYTVSQAKDDLAGILHGTNPNQVRNLNELFSRAGRKVIAEIDPIETVRTEDIPNGLYQSIYEYSAFSDLKGSKVIDIRPIGQKRTASENVAKTSIEEFDIHKRDYEFTVEFDSGTKLLRIGTDALSGRLKLHDCDSLTANGTWSAVSGGSNAVADTNQYTEGSASIRFDVGATGGGIENSTFSAVDLSDHQEKSSLLFRLYIPDVATVTSVTLSWGSDSSNYWSRTVTTSHFGSLRTGWQWMRVDWNGATQTGTVDEGSIDYLKVLVTTTTADTDFRVDEIYSALPHLYEVVYYSRFIFSSSGGTWKEIVTADTDIINLETDAYNIFLFETAIMAAQQVQGEHSRMDIDFFTRELYGEGRRQGLYAKYKEASPSQEIKVRNTYYEVF